MAKQTINIGASPNDGTGTPLRTSFDYCNLNFTELYTATGPSGNNIVVPGTATITGDLTVATSALKVVSASSRVLINQASAIQGDSLEVSAKSDGGTISLFGRASDNGATLAFRANGVTTAKASLTANDSGLSIRTGTVERYQIDTTGVSTWSVAGTTAMTLNSTGLGVGVTPYVSWPATSKALQLGASSSIEGRTNDGSRTTVYSNTVWNGTNLIYQNEAAAAYYQQAVGVHSWHTNSNTPSAGNTATFTQAMTLDASGNLLVGTTSGTLFRIISSFLSSSGNGGIKLIDSLSNNTAVFANFSNGTGTLGSITNNNNAGVLYNVTSDKRLKENISDSESASLLIDSLQVRKFDWKANNSHQRYGFIAQELVTVVPEAVYQPTNSDDMMAVDYSKLVPMLVKEIQSLRTRVQTLEAK